MSNIFSQMNLGDILDDTFHIYKSNFWRLLAITAIGLIAPLALGAVAAIAGFGSLTLAMTGLPIGALTESMIAGLILLVVASIVGGILMAGALVQAVSQQYFREEISIGPAYSFAWRRLGAMIGAAVLVFLAIGGIIALSVFVANFAWVGWILVVVCACASIYLIIRWVFIFPAALLEGLGPIAALSRSHRLVKNSWWRVLGITLVVALISGAIGGLLGIIPVVGSIIGSILVTPIYVTANTLLYYNSRGRKEEYGTEALASELHIDVS